MSIEEATTTEELVAMVRHTLNPYGMVHVDQVIAWLNRQADITRAECLEATYMNQQFETEEYLVYE